MASGNEIQIFPEKEPVFIEIKSTKDRIRYRAWIGHFVARGVTMGSVDRLKEVVARMARAEAEPKPVKHLVDMATDYVVNASMYGLMDIGVVLGTHFHMGEYLGVMVKLQRLNSPYYSTRVWAEIRAFFKGYDGLMSLARHSVLSYIEFYAPNMVDRDKLYRTIYQAVRIVYNAYGFAGRDLHA
jgi:hypothetical protein